MKKTLAALVTALSLSLAGGSACNIQPGESRPYKKIEILYENNNNSLKEGKVERVYQSIEMLTVESHYEVMDDYYNTGNEKMIVNKKWWGSGAVINQDDNHMYLLTAGHVAIPPKAMRTRQGIRLRLKDYKISIKEKGINLEFLTGENGSSMDYALLRTKRTSKLRVMDAKIGDSSRISIGDMVYAVGYPLTTGNSLTGGNISCIVEKEPVFLRNSRTINEHFMFTSPISGGNSGGPVFTIHKGQMYLVGVAVATYNWGQNLNIAVKINDIMKDLKKNGY